ncbi:nodulation protein NfeD [archaeon]|nr:nodulation protein NfeD [archaeon]
MRRIPVLLLLLALLPALHAQAGEVHVLKVDGMIDSVMSSYIERGIKDAETAGAQAVIIQMDTPGGLDTSMRAIMKNMLASDVPVVVYVSPSGARAASAGSFILVSSHVAAMAPGTNTGAAHPVSITMGEVGTVEQKITNDAAATMKSIAQERGRNATLAESFVTNSTSITAEEALMYGIIEIIADDYDDLLSQLDGMEVETASGNVTLNMAGAQTREIPLSQREDFLHVLLDPNIAYILFIAGFYGLIYELSSPGAILPGVVGGIAILLALWSFQALSVSVAGLALIVFAILLFVAETQASSGGVLAAGGAISLFLGSIFLIDSEKEPFVQLSLNLIILVTLLTALFFAIVLGYVIKAQKRRVTTGKEGMIGTIGVAKSDIDPEGNVFVHGELWKATSEKPIKKDSKVKVLEVNNLILKVSEVDSDGRHN